MYPPQILVLYNCGWRGREQGGGGGSGSGDGGAPCRRDVEIGPSTVGIEAENGIYAHAVVERAMPLEILWKSMWSDPAIVVEPTTPKANLSKKNDLRPTAASNVASHIGMPYRTFEIHPHPTISRLSLRRDRQDSRWVCFRRRAQRPAAFARRRLAAAAAMSRLERTSI